MRNTLGCVVPWESRVSLVFTNRLVLVVLVSRVCLEAVANVFLGLVESLGGGGLGWWGT